MAAFREVVMLKAKAWEFVFSDGNACSSTTKIQASTASVIMFITAVSGRERLRSVRRCERNARWWDMVWSTYDNSRFKKTFRDTRQTFNYILQNYCARENCGHGLKISRTIFVFEK